MAQDPALKQGFQNFLAPTPAPDLAIFLLWLRLRLILIKILLTPTPLQLRSELKLATSHTITGVTRNLIEGAQN